MGSNSVIKDSEKLRKQITDLRKQDYSVTEISKKLNIKYSTLYKFMKNNEIKTRRPHLSYIFDTTKIEPIKNDIAPHDSKLAQQIIDLRQEGLSITAIAQELDIPYPNLYKFMRKNEINTKGITLQLLTIEHLIPMLKRQKTIWHMACIFGVAFNTMHKFISKNANKIKKLHDIDVSYLFSNQSLVPLPDTTK